MKKVSKLLVLFGMVALIFSMGACSSDDSSDDSTTTESEQKEQEKTTTETTTDGNGGSENQGTETNKSITAVTYTVETYGAGTMSATSSTDNAKLTIFSSSSGDIKIMTADGSKPKLDSSKYVQFNTSSSAEFDALVITVSAACKATFTLNAAGNDASKIYSLNGTSLTKESSYYTKEVTLSAGENTIRCSGFKFSKIAFE